MLTISNNNNDNNNSNDSNDSNDIIGSYGRIANNK